MVSRVRRVRDIFPSKKAYDCFAIFAKEIVANGNKITVHHASQLASRMASEKVYNKANFYWYVVNPLIDLGFLDKIPTWNNALKKTQYCYVPLKFEMPRHPVSHGYYRDAWYVCEEWNQLFFERESVQQERAVELAP